MTLNHSSLRWFEIYALTSIPRGLPSSLIQHELPLQFSLAHWSSAKFLSECKGLVSYV
jgi:hypothetical protein